MGFVSAGRGRPGANRFLIFSGKYPRARGALSFPPRLSPSLSASSLRETSVKGTIRGTLVTILSPTINIKQEGEGNPVNWKQGECWECVSCK